MPAKLDITTRKLAMYRDAVNGTTVFLEKPVYGYYRISSFVTVNFEILEEKSRILAENDILKNKTKTLEEQMKALQRHIEYKENLL